MHQSSLDKMERFVKQYLVELRDKPLKILDLGSMDINGSYKRFFVNQQWKYIGIDLAEGRNVDVVLSDPYQWKEITANSHDVVVSGQAFEHMEYFWSVMQQIERVVKPEGLICIIAPSRGYEHRYPVDCWRFYPDGFRGLARYVDLELLFVETQWDRLDYNVDDSDDWGDTIAVFRKPQKRTFKRKMLLGLRRWLDSQNI
ncbi:MAG: methyltransferase type 11 [Sedimenticola sp.]|nr:MAG: methyltransferase type 11 [Sedimenticola sp.]